MAHITQQPFSESQFILFPSLFSNTAKATMEKKKPLSILQKVHAYRVMLIMSNSPNTPANVAIKQPHKTNLTKKSGCHVAKNAIIFTLKLLPALLLLMTLITLNSIVHIGKHLIICLTNEACYTYILAMTFIIGMLSAIGFATLPLQAASFIIIIIAGGAAIALPLITHILSGIGVGCSFAACTTYLWFTEKQGHRCALIKGGGVYPLLSCQRKSQIVAQFHLYIKEAAYLNDLKAAYKQQNNAENR